MKRPSVNDIDVAAEWLDVNEGAEGESESCARVAAWLRDFLDRNVERIAARQAGCSVNQLRKVMAKRKARKTPPEAKRCQDCPKDKGYCNRCRREWL